MQALGLQCIKVRQVVSAITLTPVGHKRHVQFLTSAPNFRGSSDASDPGFPSHWPWSGAKHGPENQCRMVCTLQCRV